MFPCSQCGNCCRIVGKSFWGKSMALADGSCKWFDKRTNLCTIYSERPLMCNVDECYKKFYSKQMSINDFYKINQQVCNRLQKG